MPDNTKKLPFREGDRITIEAEYVRACDYANDDGPGYVEGAILIVAGKSICVRADALKPTEQSEDTPAATEGEGPYCNECGSTMRCTFSDEHRGTVQSKDEHDEMDCTLRDGVHLLSVMFRGEAEAFAKRAERALERRNAVVESESLAQEQLCLKHAEQLDKALGASLDDNRATVQAQGPVLEWNEKDEALYKGYRIDRVDPIDRAFLGDDACHIRKIDGDAGYWVEIRNEYGSGAVSFPTVAMAVQLIDHWDAFDKAMDEALPHGD